MIDDQTKLIMKTLKLLYVEDEEDIREQLLESFKRKFIEVSVAKNGLEGLEKFKNDKPDLIVTDIKMPKINGLDMIEAIRTIDNEIPIIVTTAYSDLENIKKSLELGVDRFIQKPPNKKEIDTALYKATKAIVKQKILDDKQKIIDTILGWSPTFSIILNEENISHITYEIIGILGIQEKSDILKNLETSNIFDKDKNLINKNFSSTSELYKFLSQSQEKHHIELENKKRNKKEIFFIKSKFYEHTKLYLISFFQEES